jgi:hypothetical protein
MAESGKGGRFYDITWLEVVMSLELINTLGTVTTVAIVAAAAIAALVQLRHLRAGNQINAMLSIGQRISGCSALRAKRTGGRAQGP